MNRKLLSVFMSVALLFASFGMAFATEAVTTSAASDFSDMPDNWSTAALNKAVENGLLTGYAESGKKLIKAGNFLTRAEMATVVNRVFASEKMSDLSKVSDVSSSAWYAKDMAKAVKMGTFSYDMKMRPGDNITRQEAFTVLARAFKLVGTDADHKALDAFSDKDEIASWALDSLDGMAGAGYIQGSAGMVKPTANITRAEFATVMDNLVKDYIDVAGDVTEVAAAGNVIVRVAGVTLKDVTVKGDLIIADGVGDGDVTLDNVKVEGRTVVRGGGENSIIIKGGSELGRVIVAKVDGVVRVFAEDGAEIEVIYVDDGSDDVTVEGKFGNLEVAGEGVTVYAKDADVNNATVSGNNSKIVVGDGSKVKNGSITGDSSAIVVDEGGSVDKVIVNGNNATVSGDGEVKEVEVKEGVEGTEVGGQPVEAGQTVDGSGEPVTPPSRPSRPSKPQAYTLTFDITVVDESGKLISTEAGITVRRYSEEIGDFEEFKPEGGKTELELEVVDYYNYTIEKDGYETLEGLVEIDSRVEIEATLISAFSKISSNYYAAGKEIGFTISGLEFEKEVRVGLPIYQGEGPYGRLWACDELVLAGQGSMTEDRETIDGREVIIRYFVGTTNQDGKLTVAGEVGADLPYGNPCFTLPDYGYYIDGAIGLGVGVRPGDGVNVNSVCLGGAVSVGGIPVAGQELEATNLKPQEAIATGSVTYQWQRSDSEDGTYEDITNATGAAFTVGDDDLWVRVRATCNDENWGWGTVYSDPVEIVDYLVIPTSPPWMGLPTLKEGETIEVYTHGADDLRIMLWAGELEDVAAAKAAYYDDERVFSSRTADLVVGGMAIEKVDGVFTITINQALIEMLAAGTRYDGANSGTGKYEWSAGDKTTWIITPVGDDGELWEDYNTWDGDKVNKTFFVYRLVEDDR